LYLALLIRGQIFSWWLLLQLRGFRVTIDARVAALVEGDIATPFGIEEETVVYVFGIDDRSAYFELLCLIGRALKLRPIDLNVVSKAISLQFDGLSKKSVYVGLLLMQALSLRVWSSVLGLEFLEQLLYSYVLGP